MFHELPGRDVTFATVLAKQGFRVIVAKMRKTQEIDDALSTLSPVLVPGGQEIVGLKRLSGGASQETWAFSVRTKAGEETSLILRRTPGGKGSATSENAIGLAMEAQIQKIATAASVPVPRIVHVCAPEDGLGEAYVMGRLEGETLAPKILRGEAFASARERLATQCGQALAGIHAIDTNLLAELPESGGLDQLARYEETYLSLDLPSPVFDLTFQWLRTHAPAPLSPVLVHGDFRLGNLMVDETGLVGVLDWELAHRGDPREDLAWICVNSWRFGRADKRVGGFGDLEPLLAAYTSAGGCAFALEDIDWWEMLGSLKWGVMCMMMYEAHRSGADPSVERVTIGRRVSETEMDLVNLLERVT